MEIIAGADNYLPFDTEDKDELKEGYLNIMYNLGDLLYYGAKYMEAISGVEELFDAKIETLVDALEETPEGFYKLDTLSIIEDVIDDLTPFLFKYVKPITHLNPKIVIREYILNLQNKVNVEDTVSFGFELIDTVIEKMGGVVEYADDYKKFLEVLHSDVNSSVKK